MENMGHKLKIIDSDSAVLVHKAGGRPAAG